MSVDRKLGMPHEWMRPIGNRMEHALLMNPTYVSEAINRHNVLFDYTCGLCYIFLYIHSCINIPQSVFIQTDQAQPGNKAGI